MIFVAYEIINIARDHLSKSAIGEINIISNEAKEELDLVYTSTAAIKKAIICVGAPANHYFEDQLLKHHLSWKVFQHASTFCPWLADTEKMRSCLDFMKVINWIDQSECLRALEEVNTYIDMSAGIHYN